MPYEVTGPGPARDPRDGARLPPEQRNFTFGGDLHHTGSLDGRATPLGARLAAINRS